MRINRNCLGLGQSMEWKMEWNGNFDMEYGRCQNGMEDLKNGMEDNLTNQFHFRFRSWHLQKNIYG